MIVGGREEQQGELANRGRSDMESSPKLEVVGAEKECLMKRLEDEELDADSGEIEFRVRIPGTVATPSWDSRSKRR